MRISRFPQVDIGKSGFYQGRGLSGFPYVAWQIEEDNDEDDNQINTSAVIVDDRLYFANGNRVYAIDTVEGEEIWDFRADGNIPSDHTPAYNNGVIYIGDNDGVFYAIDEETGREVWRFEVDEEMILSPTIIIGKKVVFTTSFFPALRGSLSGILESAESAEEPYTGIYGLDLKKGLKEWSFRDNTNTMRLCSGYKNFVYIVQDEAIPEITALNVETGDEVWSKPFLSEIQSPVVFEGTLYTIDNEGNLYSINAKSGKELSKKKIYIDGEFRFFTPFATDGQTIYFGDDNTKNIYAIDIETGMVKWFEEKDDDFDTAPIIAQNRIYISAESSLFAVNIENGGKPLCGFLVKMI